MNESEISNRLKFLKDNNLANLQEEFLKTKNERNISVKIIKEKAETGSSSNFPDNKIKEHTLNKKKKKDIITLDINIVDLNKINNQSNNNNNKHSVFKSAINLNKNLVLSTNINKDTGLPNTFIVDEKLYENNLNIVNTPKTTESEKIVKKKSEIEIEGNNEYNEIHKKNMELISSMSKEELIDYKQTIKAKIPGKLLEKMKNSFFHNKLSKSNLKDNLIIENENNNVESDNEEETDNGGNIEIKKNIYKAEFTENNKNITTTQSNSTIYVKYDGEIKISVKNLNEKDLNIIDYSKYKLQDIDLSTKFFSLIEIKHLLMSSSEQHIIIGLKISTHLIQKKYITDLKLQELDLWNIYYYFIDHKNINIKIISLDNFIKMLNILFSDDIKLFSNNFLYYNNFPVFRIKYLENTDENSSINNKIILKVKKDIVDLFSKVENIIKNSIYSKNFIKLILSTVSGNNKNILNDENFILNYFSLFFYFFYLSETFYDNFKNTELESKFKELLKNQEIIFKNLKNLKKINKILLKSLIMIFNSINNNDIEEYKTLIANSIFSQNNKLNYIIIVKTGGKFENFDLVGENKNYNNLKIVDFNILNKFLNEETFENLLLKHTIETIELKDYLFDSSLNYKEITKLSRLLLLQIKYSKYTLNLDLDYFIVSSKSEITILEDLLNKLCNYLKEDKFKSDNNFLELNAIFDLVNTITIFATHSIKYPKCIKYMQSINIRHLENLIPTLEKYSLIYLNYLKQVESTETKDDKFIENLKFEFLYKTENFTKLNLSVIKNIQKYGKNSTHTLVNLILIIPSFFNTNCESYYFKFLKYINIHFTRKISNSEYLNSFTKKINFSYDALVEDLNLYLNSNEDLRKSHFFKNNLNLKEDLNNIFFNYTKKSKFLPFNNHFIFQVLYNDKLSSEVKLNYIIFLTIICSEEKINNHFNFVEIILKTLVKFRDIINENKAELIFNEFIKILILRNLNDIKLEKNNDNEIYVQMFFNKFEFDNPVEKEVSYNYKLLILFFLIYHNDHNLAMENLNLLLYTNFSKMYEKLNYDNLGFLENDKAIVKISDYILTKLSVKKLDLYETLIITYLKYKLNFQKGYPIPQNNFLIILSKKLIDKFALVKNIEDMDEIEKLYSIFISKKAKEIKEVIDKIYEKLVE